MGKVVRRSIYVFICAMISSCVPITELSIPADYVGPRAVIKSTKSGYSTKKADLFYLEKVEGRYINSAFMAADTMSISSYGLIVDPVFTNVRAAANIKLQLVGMRVFASPPGLSLGSLKLTSREIVVELKADQTYLVKGEVGEDMTRVWLENSVTGEIFEN